MTLRLLAYRFVFCSAVLCAAAAPGFLTPAWADEPHTITMAGHGEASAAPDRVAINAGVTTNAATAAAALAANTARMKQVFAALEALAVPRKNIQTTNFSVSPQYSNGQNNEARRLTGYQVSNQLRVRLEDVASLGKALDALVGAGANQMNGIDYTIADPAPLLDKARGEAIADARGRAQTYARAAGVTLGPIVSISEGASGPRPMYRAMPMMTAASAPVPVAAGEESVSADVTVVWQIH